MGIGRALMQGLFERLLTRRFHSGLLWVLADNPARFFYQTVGGKLIGRREELIWGVSVKELAYGWPDLSKAVAILRRSSQVE